MNPRRLVIESRLAHLEQRLALFCDCSFPSFLLLFRLSFLLSPLSGEINPAIRARRPLFTTILPCFYPLDLVFIVARSLRALTDLDQLIRCSGPTYSKQACYLPDAEVRPEKIPEKNTEKIPEKPGGREGRSKPYRQHKKWKAWLDTPKVQY